jgi:hypothetical protein
LNPLGAVTNRVTWLRGTTVAKPLGESVSSCKTTWVRSVGFERIDAVSVRWARSASEAKRRATSASGSW